jgi:hypothetical protein
MQYYRSHFLLNSAEEPILGFIIIKQDAAYLVGNYSRALLSLSSIIRLQRAVNFLFTLQQVSVLCKNGNMICNYSAASMCISRDAFRIKYFFLFAQ